MGVANGLCFSLANLLELPVELTPLLYLLGLLAGLTMVRPLQVARTAAQPNRFMWLCCASFILVLVLPRAIYPTEWLSGHTVDVMFDDYARLAELVAMTLSSQYPLQHPANDELLLSFYYAALLPMATLKLLAPLLTLKDCIFIGSTLYGVLLGLSLLEVSLRITKNQMGASLLLFLCTWFAGLDWLTGSILPFYSHSEWWALQLFEKPSQISAFYTAANWTIHHFLGFYLPLLAWVFWRYCRGQFHWQKAVLVPMLLISGVFHSPLAFMPVILMGLPWLVPLLRRYTLRWTSPLLLLTFVAPLPVFLGRLPGASLQLRFPLLINVSESLGNYLLSALAYLSALPVVDLAALPFTLILLWPHLGRLEKYLTVASALFFLSTLGFHIPLFNNYSMRGMLLPSFILFALIARHLPSFIESRPRLWGVCLAVTLLLGGIGGFREMLSSARYALWAGNQTRQACLGDTPHPDWYGRYRSLARDSSTQILVPWTEDWRQQRPYLAEKILPNTKPGKLSNMEREIARRVRKKQDEEQK